jgi:hypothetical protein
LKKSHRCLMLDGRLNLERLECIGRRCWTWWGPECPGPRAVIVLCRHVEDYFPGGGHADYCAGGARRSAEISTVGAFRQRHMKIGQRDGKSPTQAPAQKDMRGMNKQDDIAHAMSSR